MSSSSLFDSPPPSRPPSPIAIPGLILLRPALPASLEQRVLSTCTDLYFHDGSNQAMLFSSRTSLFPPILAELLAHVQSHLEKEEKLPRETYDRLFPTLSSHTNYGLARQAIVNLYLPGQGISPHVDLVGRYADGIIGVSMGSGCAMAFSRTQGGEEQEEVYLERGSILVLEGDARYEWTHAIEERYSDVVRGASVPRHTRMSVTYRWMLPGADVVGK